MTSISSTLLVDVEVESSPSLYIYVPTLLRKLYQNHCMGAFSLKISKVVNYISSSLYCAAAASVPTC
jgi:hypothetical protein